MGTPSYQSHAPQCRLSEALVTYAKLFKYNTKALTLESHISIEKFALMNFLSQLIAEKTNDVCYLLSLPAW